MSKPTNKTFENGAIVNVPAHTGSTGTVTARIGTQWDSLVYCVTTVDGVRREFAEETVIRFNP